MKAEITNWRWLGSVTPRLAPIAGQRREHRVDPQRGQRQQRRGERHEFGESDRRAACALRAQMRGRLVHCALPMAEMLRCVTPADLIDVLSKWCIVYIIHERLPHVPSVARASFARARRLREQHRHFDRRRQCQHPFGRPARRRRLRSQWVEASIRDRRRVTSTSTRTTPRTARTAAAPRSSSTRRLRSTRSRHGSRTR